MRAWLAMARAALALVSATPDQGPLPSSTSGSVSMRSIGESTIWCPIRRSAAAVRSASACGRVRSTRTICLDVKEVWAGAPLELAAGVGADRRRIRHSADALGLERLAAVRLHDQPAEMQRAAAQARVSGDRRPTGAVEHGKEGPLAFDRSQRRRVIDGSENIARRAVVLARLDADRALPDSGKKVVDLEHAGGGVGEPQTL